MIDKWTKALRLLAKSDLILIISNKVLDQQNRKETFTISFDSIDVD